MGRLVYGMITSLDGSVSADSGDIGEGAEDPEVHAFIGDLYRSVRTFLYGRRMYETMRFWETAHELPDAPPHIVEYARDWQAADKVVFSTSLDEPTTARTTLERSFDPVAIRERVAASDHDVTIDGPTLAGQALAAGIVDEVHLFVTTTVVGGGRPFFPEGLRLELELLDHRRFPSGLLWLRYGVRRAASTRP